MKSKVACLIASLTLANGLIGCSSNTNSQNQTAATTTPSEIDNSIECKYLYLPTNNCKQSTPSSPIALSQNTYNPEFSSSLSTSESYLPGLTSKILSNTRNPLSPPKQLSSKLARRPKKIAKLSSPYRPSSQSSQLAKFTSNSNLVAPNTDTQLSSTNTQLETSTYNLDNTNNDQATSPVVDNTPTIEFSQPTVVTEVTTNELQLPSSRKNNLAKASQTQAQELPPPRNLLLPSEQLNAELTTANIQKSITNVTVQQVSKNEINSGLNTNRLPVPLSTSNSPPNSQQITPSISNNDSQPSLPTNSVDLSVNQPAPQLNTNQLQPELNLSPNQLNPGLNTNEIQGQFPGNEKTLQSRSQSTNFAINNQPGFSNNEINLELTTSRSQPQLPFK